MLRHSTGFYGMPRRCDAVSIRIIDIVVVVSVAISPFLVLK
jgi:hypothetical protein